MASPDTDMQRARQLRSFFANSLSDFHSTNVHDYKPLDVLAPPNAKQHHTREARTLFVLDSSFNPPSKAHVSLVKSALRIWEPKSEQDVPTVIFLLATTNADKKPKPAELPDRIVMMYLAAQQLQDELTKASRPDIPNPTIDIGVTKKPFFVDKAKAIHESNYHWVPGTKTSEVTQQVHLTGFDTLLRILTPKYYPDHDPPLTALEPFLKHHKVRTTIRVDKDSPSANLADAQATKGESDLSTVQGQKKYLEDIKQGSLERQGLKKDWAQQIDLVIDDSGEADGVSSTRVRNAVKNGNWETVRSLVGEKVAEYIEQMQLYQEDEGGVKL
jgi:nicotinamide-nucleotide adenylyltransferase